MPPTHSTTQAIRAAALGGRYRRRHVIGYAGIAALLKVNPQSLRRLQWAQNRPGRDPKVTDMPPPLRNVGPHKVALFDYEQIVEWAVHTGRLAPDRVTPQQPKHAGGVRTTQRTARGATR